MEEEIKRLNNILRVAETETPLFLNGLLIPSRYITEFHFLLGYLKERAKESEIYRQQINEITIQSQKAVNDFINSLMNKKIEITERVKEGNK